MTGNVHWFVVWLITPLLLTAPPSPAVGQADAVIDTEARKIFDSVLSPYCPGRTISNCPSPQADVLRETIKEKVAAGEPADEIREELYATFGEELRTIPRARGFGLFAWIVPGLVFLAGGWTVVSLIRRTKIDKPGSSESIPAKIDAESDARLKAELAELEALT